jgi:hypothetical protein
MTPLYRPRKHELVAVYWVDAQHDSSYDGTAEAYEPSLASLEDVGFFVKRTKESITLASCIERKTSTVRFMVDIPTKLVSRIETREPEAK